MSHAWIPAPLAAVAAACLSFAAHAQNPAARIVPASPLQFERVHLRLVVDDCSFDKTSVTVELQGRSLRVHHRRLPCVAASMQETVDIQLGALPAGDYRAELVDDVSGNTMEIVDFRVERLAQTLQFPPAPFALADYSGLWSAPDAPGWGLAIQQGPSTALFGELLIFDRNSEPQWFTLQAGHWLSATRWSGQLIRSRGNYWAAPDYGPPGVSYSIVGAVGIDFHMSPGVEDAAVLSYMIDGEFATRVIRRSQP